MAKRTLHEIEKDFKEIRKAVETTHVISIREIAEAVGLSESEVKTSLSKHPRIEKNIMDQLEKNKEELKAKKKSEKEALEAQKRAEDEAKRKQELELETAETKVANEAVYPEQTTDFESGVVIDASITGIEKLQDILSQFSSKSEKIILTSVTIKELERMQRFRDIDAMDARRILAMAVENQNSFHTVQIDESLETPDDCIIKYCADHKEKVSLLTSDKTMALKARMYGVRTQYLKQTNSTQQVIKPKTFVNDRRNTLYLARKVGDDLFITDFNNDYRSVLLISNGFEYTDGKHVLKIGDDIYMATKKDGYTAFAHYQITSLDAENNCKLMYSKRIYNGTDISYMPKAGYKSFVRDFKSRHDL